MRIVKINSRHNRDFWADMEREFCGHQVKNDSGYDDANYHQNVIPQMVCPSCKKTGAEFREQQHEKIINELKEIAHYFGGWDDLRKEIERLEQNDNEAAHERRMNNY